MSSNRREFIEKLGATAVLGALPMTALSPMLREVGTPAAGSPEPGQAAQWDFSWVNALKGKKHKVCMDCAEVESGYGVWRSTVWAAQYQEVLGAKPADIATVLVLRHNALVLGFQQDLWNTVSIGQSNNVTHPLTQQGTTRNPALLTSTQDGTPANLDAFALPNFIQRGGIVLACNLALDFFVAGMSAKLGIPADEARKRAIAAFVPGVKLMPSGVFAALKAQDEGCHYLRAS